MVDQPAVEVEGLYVSYGSTPVLVDVAPHRAGRRRRLRDRRERHRQVHAAALREQPAAARLGRDPGLRPRRPASTPEFWRDVVTTVEPPTWYPGLTIREHAELVCRAHGQDPEQAGIDEALERLRPGRARRRDPAVALVRAEAAAHPGLALLRPSSLLILDEPEQRLDPEGREYGGRRCSRDYVDGRRLAADGQPRRGRSRPPPARTSPRWSRWRGARRRDRLSTARQPVAALDPPHASRPTASAAPPPATSTSPLLFVAVVGGMRAPATRRGLLAAHPNASRLAGAALVPAGVGVLFLALRRLGPLGLSRPAASWLLPAPVSRRRLLLPSLRLATSLAAIVRRVLGVAIVGHARPAGARSLVGCSASARWPASRCCWSRWPRRPAAAGALADRVAAAARGRSGRLRGGLGGRRAAGRRRAGRSAPPPGRWRPGRSGRGAAAVAVGRLARTPNERILESAKTAGTLLDSAFGMEPSFVADMIERRYWARRRLRSARLPARVPVLVAQDLLLRPAPAARLLWLPARSPCRRCSRTRPGCCWRHRGPARRHAGGGHVDRPT